MSSTIDGKSFYNPAAMNRSNKPPTEAELVPGQLVRLDQRRAGDNGKQIRAPFLGVEEQLARSAHGHPNIVLKVDPPTVPGQVATVWLAGVRYSNVVIINILY
jgi:hypothetical protein